MCLTWLVITFVGQRTEVDGSSMEPMLTIRLSPSVSMGSMDGSSMEPMLTDGDNLIVDKITYRFRDPQRFDIIVFPFKYQENTYYIKRIIGLPGETIQIDEQGNIYIDGEVLEENYGREIIEPDNIGIAASPIVLGEDEYFVMGDNRNNSRDSREAIVGNIRREDIIGRAWVRIWPLSHIGVLKHQ